MRISKYSAYYILSLIILLSAVFGVVSHAEGIEVILPVEDGVPVEVQDFNSMGSEYVLSSTKNTTSASIIKQFESEFGWTLNSASGAVNLSRMAGSSGKSDDYAVRIGRLKTGSDGTFALTGWKNPVTDGTITVEFDLCFSPSEYADIRIKGMSYVSSSNLVFQGVFHGTEFATESNIWYHVKLEQNTATNLFSMWVDGEKLMSDIDGSFNSLREFVFAPSYWSNASYWVTNGWAYVGIDNFRIYNTKVIYPVYEIADAVFDSGRFSYTIRAKSGSLTDEKYSVITAMYDGDVLTDIIPDMNKVATSNLKTDTVSYYQSDDVNRIRVFLWGGESGIAPLVPSVCIEAQPDVADTTPLTFSSLLDTEAEAKSLLASDAVFATSSSKCYISKAKRDYSEFANAPYTTDSGVFMVPADMVASALDYSMSVSGSTLKLDKRITLTADSVSCTVANKYLSFITTKVTLDTAPVIKDGVFYIPIKTFASKAADKYVYEDHRGYILISSTDRNYSDNMDESWNSSDIIHRYIHFDRPTPDGIYNDIKNGGLYRTHPRVYATREEFMAFKAKIPTHSEYTTAYNNLITKCNTYLTAPLTKYEKPDGLRLYGALSTNAGGMISQLGIAYQLTDDERYAERAWKELENILTWQDWNLDDHNLDSGSAVPSIVMGYDCIYDYLSDVQRRFFKGRFQKMYLDYAVGMCTGESGFNVDDSRIRYSNWGAVCSEGMFSAALALIDEEDENTVLTQKCKFLLSQSIEAFEYPLGRLFPTGTTDEGPLYWDYYFSAITEVCSQLKRIAGSDYSLLSSPGFTEGIYSFLYTQDSLGVWPYSDTSMTLGNYFPETTFLYAKMMGDTNLADTLYAFKNSLGKTLGMRFALCYDIPTNVTSVNYPLDYYDKGQQLTVMKSSWNDKNALYLAVRGGKTIVIDHYDKGAFVFDALGVRWLHELGSEDYGVTKDGNGYWDANTRLNCYRVRTEGHNSLVINPSPSDRGQEVDVEAKVTNFESSDSGCTVTYDLKACYGNKVSAYQRRFNLTDNRSAAVVQDEFTLTGTSDLYSFFHTKADVSINSDGKSATFTQNGKTMRMEFDTNLTSWHLEVMDAEPLSPDTWVDGETSRKGIRKLAFVAEKASGDVVISAKIVPQV